MVPQQSRTQDKNQFLPYNYTQLYNSGDLILASVGVQELMIFITYRHRICFNKSIVIKQESCYNYNTSKVRGGF